MIRIFTTPGFASSFFSQELFEKEGMKEELKGEENQLVIHLMDESVVADIESRRNDLEPSRMIGIIRERVGVRHAGCRK